MKIIIKMMFFSLLTGISLSACKVLQHEVSDQEIDQSWQEGKTLSSSVFKKYPLPVQEIKGDKGINVMIDLAHQCKFATMWGLPDRLNEMGFRAIGSQAGLHTVLDPDGQCRVRFRWDEENKIYPFAWHPNFEYNVIISNQSDPSAQEYLPEEQDALIEFVADGGGLIVFGVAPKTEEQRNSWSLNELCKKLGAQFLTETDNYRGQQYAVLEHSDVWSENAVGDNNKPVIIYRKYKKGHVMLVGHEELLQANRKEKANMDEKNDLLTSALLKVSQGKEPVGGEARYPMSGGGGGGIYPEIEKHFDDIVLFYAANQKPELIKTVDQDIPKAKELVEQWLPSKPTLEPMYLILSSGGGGGWAVNAFKPKENGIISLSPDGIISIFAHELAHTMHGPVNEKGQIAGITPIPNRGEAHAGWFQGKVDAWFNKELQAYPVKQCNKLFEFDADATKLNLVTHYENDLLHKEFGKGKDWVKTWWIWQKLDDRYGETWYPRWRWVQHTRWKETPDHRLSWDEMVEDMSIAVGEDLFPFMRKSGLSLEKERLETVMFEGKELKLDVAPLEVSPAGVVRLGAIGDYKAQIQPAEE